ncbi:MAG: hypothetical protein R3B47_16790 [Bacteroidia bacterium]
MGLRWNGKQQAAHHTADPAGLGPESCNRAVGLFVLGWVFDTYTDASFAYWDAYTTGFQSGSAGSFGKKAC